MKKITLFSFFLCAIIIGTGCSKEKRIEHRLERTSSWNITRIDYQKAQIGGGAGISAKVGTELNAGTMVFNKDGSGNYDYTLDGLHRVGTFKWTVAANNVSFNYVAATTTDFQAVSYNILNDSKTDMDLQGSEAVIGWNGIFTLNATFHISK